MADVIDIWVEGIPKAQPRARAFARGGRAGVYDPGTADAWKATVAMALKNEMVRTGFNQTMKPILLRLDFQMPRPKSHSNSKGALKPAAPHHHTTKPDLDNLEKAVMDALTSAWVWGDDSQVCGKISRKVYVDSNRPGVRIVVSDAPRWMTLPSGRGLS